MPGPQDPFAQYAVQSAQADPFAAYAAQPEKPAQTSFLDSALNFASNFAHTVDPRPALKVLYDFGQAGAGVTSGRPEQAQAFFDDLKGIGQSHAEQFKKAKKAYDEGRISEAVGHTMAAALPLVGPGAAAAGEQIGSGDIAGGLGAGAGMVAGMVAPEVIRRVPAVKVPALAAPRDAAIARAVETGQSMGVPIDAATATQNPFVKAAQKVADESLLGSVVSSRAKAAQQAGLQQMGETLAGRAHPSPVAGSQAGSAAQQGLRDVVSAHKAAADDAYTRLREMEARPEHAVEVAPTIPAPRADAPPVFTMKPLATVDEIFDAALKDARDSGYKGKPSDLRATFDARVEQARNLKAATAEGGEYNHAALMKAIQERGGLRPFDKDFTPGAATQKMRGEFQTAQQVAQKRYGANAIFRNDGLALDDMLQQLSEDPKWSAVITPETDLIDIIHRGEMNGPKAPAGNLEEHLRGVGVQPGTAWWMEGAQSQIVPMAVDISETKAAMQPVYDRLARKRELTGSLMGSEGQAFMKLDALLNGPDVAPLSVADAALSDLKRMARSNNPDLRTAGQGIAARAVSNLHRAVGEAAERAGTEAVTALEEGRTATKAKYAAADILKRLEGGQGATSPGTAFRGLTTGGDVAAPHLRNVLTEAPATKSLIGRAVLDGILGNETKGAAAKYSAWQRVGPETKQLLYTPEHVRALDDFFTLQKAVAENPNPSGSGMVVLKGGELAALYHGNPVYTITAPMVSALLHSQTGVRLLTRGFRLPSAAPAARAAWVSAVSKALADSGAAMPAPTYAGEPRQ